MVKSQKYNKQKRRLKKRAFLLILISTVVALTMLTGVSFAFFDLGGLGSLERFAPSQATILYDSQGRVIGKLFEENRIVVPISQMPQQLQHAVVAVEDERFYQHVGIDIFAIARAMWRNLKAGAITEGGSTITQQLVKNAILTQEQTWSRKIKDAILALVIERRYSKQEILEAYLNQIYFGEGVYGVEAAAQQYFGKPAKDLTLSECAMLAGLPRNPEYYSPYAHPQEAKGRRNLVLNKMAAQNYITRQQAEAASQEAVRLAGKKPRIAQASYYMDYIADQLAEKYGAQKVYRGGLKVYTSLDIDIQKAAEGVLGKYQGAVLAIDPQTGYIKAMVGGRDYQESQLNRATTFFRQPGSLMKPFVYAAAFDQGYKQNDIILDKPVTIDKYSPQNYDKKFRGPITMKKAVRLSVNVAAVKMLNQVGIDTVMNYAAKMGITSLTPEDRNLALALGGITKGVTLLEITSAYTAFATNGIICEPLAIIRVEDANGHILEEHGVNQRSVLRAETAYLVTDMLRAVIEAPDGTGSAARIGRPAAGKTGTTDNYRTAWFVGFTPNLAAGIYLGNDDMTPVGVAGGNAAVLWGEFMRKAVGDSPVQDFAVPPGIITGIRVATNTGKLATPFAKEVEVDAFIRGTEPRGADKGQLSPSNSPEEQTPQKPRFKLPPIRLPSFSWPF